MYFPPTTCSCVFLPWDGGAIAGLPRRESDLDRWSARRPCHPITRIVNQVVGVSGFCEETVRKSKCSSTGVTSHGKNPAGIEQEHYVQDGQGTNTLHRPWRAIEFRKALHIIFRHTLWDIWLSTWREISSPHKLFFHPAIGEVDHNVTFWLLSWSRVFSNPFRWR